MSQHHSFFEDHVRFEYLLNESSNGASYSHGINYTLDQPTVISTVPGYNTRINVTSTKPNSVPIPVVYNRLNPSIINDILLDIGSPVIYPSNIPFSTKDIVDKLLVNEFSGINIQPHEFINQTHTEITETIDVTFTNNSLVWLPGTVTIGIVPASARITESGDVRITESGDVRITETA